MAHPIFSLSTKPDQQLRRYEDESGKNYIEVRPSSDGLDAPRDPAKPFIGFCFKWFEKRGRP